MPGDGAPRPSPAAGMQAGRREVFPWDGARRSGNTCGVPWLSVLAVPAARGEPSPPCGAPGVPACPRGAPLARVSPPWSWQPCSPWGCSPPPRHALAPRGAGAFLRVSVSTGVPGRLFTQLGGGVGPLPGNSGLLWLVGLDPNIWIPPVPGNSWLQSRCLHHHGSLPARLSWDGSRSPPGAPVPLAAAAAFLQRVPSRGSGTIPGARVPRLAPALASVMPPAHGSRSAGAGG